MFGLDRDSTLHADETLATCACEHCSYHRRGKFHRLRAATERFSKQIVDVMKHPASVLLAPRPTNDSHGDGNDDDDDYYYHDDDDDSHGDDGHDQHRDVAEEGSPVHNLAYIFSVPSQQVAIPRLRSRRGQRIARIRSSGRDEVRLVQTVLYAEEMDDEEEEDKDESKNEDEGKNENEETLDSFIAALASVQTVEELERALAELQV